MLINPQQLQAAGGLPARLRVLDTVQTKLSYAMFYRSSYPERNFEWNQLLDSSIGLSPLCSTDTIDLHVKTATDFHHSFLGLRLRQA